MTLVVIAKFAEIALGLPSHACRSSKYGARLSIVVLCGLVQVSLQLGTVSAGLSRDHCKPSADTCNCC